MKVLMIDNYDSFTYNLVHILEGLNVDVTVKRNDQFELEEVEQYDKIMLSPGPGIPDEAGLTKQVIMSYAESKPILGICLGHQAIAECFGGRIMNLKEVYHGVGTPITVDNDYLFEGCTPKLIVGRYHSWAVDGDSLPSTLEITGEDENGIVMSLKHKTLDVRGVQFHPESILTPLGAKIIENWIKH